MSTELELEQQWPIPDELTSEGLRAANAIRDFLTENGLTYHGGGGRFYAPTQWAERGETYGTSSLLVVTHDGGDHAPAFNLDYGRYELNERLQAVLREHGMYVEACTCWYSAVYQT